ncbi:polyketide synthase [Robiginitalea aurantiaca]|uniref:Amino acid adenylation domain-containing protein n=1 Tax=Robiginitalea aurantiaca TaxID=3056915 RepID=A0ABT7WBK9_9FLAO|nr:polyketide synthase [Robiginitalea aurantiaca]MDM9630299.1 amino acid adenylation domain-containing protein [Robiginitalea aurantiaca]
MSKPNQLYLLFERAARLFPDERCIVSQDAELTYKQTEHEALKVCNAVLSSAGDEDFIGIPTTRSIEQIIFVLGVLKAGKTYLPIDFGYPEKRLQSIIDNSQLSFCLTTEQDAHNVASAGLKPLSVKESSQPHSIESTELKKKDLITYILYTSGSTGEPKGVCMGEEATVNLINWQNNNSNCHEGTRTLQFAPLSFDVSFQEIFSTLSTGGTLVLIDEVLRLDMAALLNFLKEQEVNRLFLPFVALQALAEAALSTETYPTALKEVMTAGEQLKVTSQVRHFFSRLNDCVLFNQYGPTECHVVTELKLEGQPSEWPALPTIGKPITNTSVYILDENLNLLPEGNAGELCIAGRCLAHGYLNNKVLTDEKFIHWKSPDKGKIRIYRTGDVAKYLADGTIEFLGRRDDQVKISGHRIELAEVELAINSLEGIRQTVVVASNHLGGQTQLVAYMESSKKDFDIAGIRQKVSMLLPDYMVPSYYMRVEGFRKTSSGKIDRKKLPAPQFERPGSFPPLRKPVTKIQKNIAKTWIDILQIPEIGIDDNFFELGGTSLLAQKVVALLLKEFNYTLPVTKLYQFPNIAGISDYLTPAKPSEPEVRLKKGKVSNSNRDVAIIGMAGRFPGASTIGELWNVLKEGKETISFFSKEELDKAIPETLRNDPLYVGARGILPSAKEFDASFFGLNPMVASVMDPQQRLFMEISWEVLEQSGYLPRHYKGRVGVYAGCGLNTYYINNVLPNTDVIEKVGEFQANTVNEKDYIATRTSYHLNLKGPAVSVHSACSTSLLAIAEATEALRNGQCDIALAGAASVTSPMNSGHLYQEGSIKSKDGHCKPFDADGSGTLFSDGAGVVLLKNLEQAEADGDTIYGLIKGVGINNDGGDKGSFTAPSVKGQADAIRMAMEDADVSPSEISYIEAHGTATPVGDPIEIEGLEMAFGEQTKNNFCAIGSIKSNMGHLTSAAGVAGFIKTVLAFRHRQIPPSLGYSRPNPLIDFDNKPFFVNNILRPWDSETKRKAGISSFGVGGTNVHIVVEEYENKVRQTDQGRPVQLLTWSAKSQNSLEGYQKALGNYLTGVNGTPLADIAYSLSLTRDVFNQKRFLVASSLTGAQEELLAEASKQINSGTLRQISSELGFLFPGQGSQFLQMGRELYEKEIVFREAVDRCAALIMEGFKMDIREVIFPDTPSPEAENKLKDTRYTQPALFIIEYALAQLWYSWSIEPTFVCGHSIGEFVAAHLAGVFTLPDALKLITLRGKLVSELPGGSMLSVRASAEDIFDLLPEGLSMAAINSDNLCVVSGPDEEIEQFAQDLKAGGIANMLLATSHAFHSTMMEPILEVFENEVKKIALSPPQLPIISTVTGKFLSQEEATDPRYWTDHLREAVRFSDALDTIIDLDESVTLLEVGPGRALSTLARQKKGGKSLVPITSLTVPKAGENAYHTVLTGLGQLWLKGIEPDWNAFYKGQSRQKVMLPSYVFNRKTCWIDPPELNLAGANSSTKVYESIPNATSEIALGQEQPDAVKALQMNSIMRKDIILQKISDIISEISGIEIESGDSQYSFLELGLDSLVLTQMATTCKKEFETAITFRQLSDDLNSPELLASYLDKTLPEERFAPEPESSPAPVRTPVTGNPGFANPVQMPQQPLNANYDHSALGLIAQQLQLLGQQINLLQSNGPVQTGNVIPPNEGAMPSPAVGTNDNSDLGKNSTVDVNEDSLTEEEKAELKKPFGASPRIERQTKVVESEHEAFLQELVRRYNTKTALSKEYAQKHRAHMADPRVVTGFKPGTKELVYPIVIEKSAGNRLWDLDGNEYIDALNGFGSCLFGHQPDFIKEVLHAQIEQGYEVGPQHPMAGEVCELLCEFTGHERAALCNTGSEAVLGAVRIARTVTGRSLIVSFKGAYHGINDEALVRGSKKLKTFPAAAGILSDSVQNVLVLEYGTDESLRIIRERAHELAAVLVEPVQSRRPEFRPVEFLREVRAITKASETVLIFDEVITGFRMHPGGAQALFDIKADVATYGKVIGGGISIGAITGDSDYMDALDGGFWRFGDQSYPEKGVTYFAGTFVRHPLALAAAKASLLRMREKGDALQNQLNTLTENYANDLNAEFKKRKLPMEICYFGSLWRLKFLEDIPYSELLFVLLREKGIHIWDGFPCFMTTSFNAEDISRLKNAFMGSIEELMAASILKSDEVNADPISNGISTVKALNEPPVPGARLGIDEAGNPAWFIKDKGKNGSFTKIKL